MSHTWNCTRCPQSFEYDRRAAVEKLEDTTVYTPDRTAKALVCSNCGSLLEPLVDDVPPENL